jgi:hypothetical protein
MLGRTVAHDVQRSAWPNQLGPKRCAATTWASVEQGERTGQVEAERGSPDRTGTCEAERRRQRSRRHGGGCAPVVVDGSDGFLQ